MKLRYNILFMSVCAVSVGVYVQARKNSDAAYERKVRIEGRIERKQEHIRTQDVKKIELLEKKAKKAETLAAQASAAQKRALNQKNEKEAYQYLERARKFENQARNLRIKQENLEQGLDTSKYDEYGDRQKSKK